MQVRRRSYAVVTLCLNPLPQCSSDTSPAHVQSNGPRSVTHFFPDLYTCINAVHNLGRLARPIRCVRLGSFTYPGRGSPHLSEVQGLYIYIYCWRLVLKCYELRTRQHKMLNIITLRPTKHYSLKD
jgi:hypothetical protein